MNTKDLISLKKKIENIDIRHHIEIFRIFQENNVSYSENRNGIFINMNNINTDIIAAMITAKNFNVIRGLTRPGKSQ